MMKKLLACVLVLLLSGASAIAQQLILKGSSSYPLQFLVVDTTDGKTGMVGCSGSMVVKIRKNGGSSVSPSGALTEVDATNFPGTYQLAGHSSDTDTDGLIQLEAYCTGSDHTTAFVGQVVEFDPRGATPTVANVADAVRDEACSGAVTSATLGKDICDTNTNVAVIVGGLVVRFSTAQAGGASTITLDSGASATDNLYTGNVITIVSGTGAGQTRTILSYVGSTKVATVNRAWATNPSSSSVFSLVAP